MRGFPWLACVAALGACIDFDRAHENCLDGGWCDPRLDSGTDAGTDDAGTADAGSADAGSADAGTADAGIELLHSSAAQTNRVAVDAEGVYWVDRRVPGEVVQLQRDGGLRVLASMQCGPNDLVVTPEAVWWGNAGGNNCYGGIAMRRRDAGAPEVVWPPLLSDGGPDDGGHPTSLAVDASGAVYWTDFLGDLVRGWSPDGGTTTIPGQPNATGVTVDSTSFYWTTAIDDGGVFRQPLGGGPTTPIATHQNEPARLAVFGGFVYWANRDLSTGSIKVAPLDGGPVVTLASAQRRPDGIAVDDTGVYWANSDTVYSIMRVRLDGGLPVALLPDPHGLPSGLAIDATHIYWTNPGGQIYRAPKPP